MFRKMRRSKQELTKEECIEQARHQACTKFRIMDNI